MSYQSRERKRRVKAAMQNAVAKQRRAYAYRHYLTPVKRNCCCNRCGTSLRVGRHDCVYRHTAREILCLDCANHEQVRYRPSSKWEAQHRQRRRSRRQNRDHDERDDDPRPDRRDR
jgi:hypothetical protein